MEYKVSKLDKFILFKDMKKIVIIDIGYYCFFWVGL